MKSAVGNEGRKGLTDSNLATILWDTEIVAWVDPIASITRQDEVSVTHGPCLFDRGSGGGCGDEERQYGS